MLPSHKGALLSGSLADDDAGWASPILSGGRVLAGTTGGNLVVFAAGRKKKCLGRFQLPGSANHAPVVTKNLVYITADEELLKLRLPE